MKEKPHIPIMLAETHYKLDKDHLPHIYGWTCGILKINI